MFARHPRLPLEIHLDIGTGESTGVPSIDSWVDAHYRRLRNAFSIADKNTAAAARSQKSEYDKRTHDIPLVRGDRVLLRNNKNRLKKIGSCR